MTTQFVISVEEELSEEKALEILEDLEDRVCGKWDLSLDDSCVE